MPEKSTSFNDFKLFIFSRLFLKQLFLAFGICIILFLILINGLAFITRHGEEVSVPSVLNLQSSEGTKLLLDQRFKVEVDSVFVNDKAGGTIIEQSPEAGAKVKENRTIYLTMVTFQAPIVHLPKFEDTPYKEYQSDLTTIGLGVDSITYRPDVAQDLVLGVTFKHHALTAGIGLPKGSRVNLILGDGNGGTVLLPNLTGLNLDEAKFGIRGSQLLLGRVVYDSTTHDSLKARVYRQTPAARADTMVKVSQGTLIDLYLKD